MQTYRMMPTNVRRFIWLFLASLAISFVYIPFTPTPPGVSYASMVAVLIIEFVIVDLVFLTIAWLATWRRQNWARWALLLVFAAALVSDALMPISFYSEHPFLVAVTLLSTIPFAAALYFLFTADARTWFGKPIQTPPA